MADPSDIAEVRKNADLADDDAYYTDDLLGTLIDFNGVAGTSAIVWAQKAAALVEEVDVTEGSASHKFTDLHKNALNMANFYKKLADSETAAETATGPRVADIVRET